MAEAQKIDTEKLHWLGMEAPRYTSYPSAHHFSPQVNEATHAQWLESIAPDATVSVYVHIPFCKELCWFCGCHTKMTKRYSPVSKYVGVLLKEIESLKQHIKGKGKLVNIHFGGGSPSMLEDGDLTSILSALTSTFGSNTPEEVAIELDPRTTTPEKILSYANLGFNRASIGIQDFDPVVQEAINRVQPYPQVKEVMDGLRSAGIMHLNCDLIYGLPHQTMERFRDTLEKTLSLAPVRISLFSYAHVPQVKKHQRMIQTEWLPSETEKLNLYQFACKTLADNGYVAIGIDHFARADDSLSIAMKNRTMRRNFQGYVTDTTDVLIGIGCSSISQFPQGYAQNNANMPDYRERVENGQLPTARGRILQSEDPIRKCVIDELMCFMSVDLGNICKRYNLPQGHFAPELAKLQDEKYHDILSINGESIHITTPLRMAARVVSSVFDQYHGVAAGRYSKVA